MNSALIMCAAAKDGEETTLIVPLPNVCDCTLRKVLQYCIKHIDFARQLTCQAKGADGVIRREMEIWNKKYITVSSCNFRLSSLRSYQRCNHCNCDDVVY